MSIPDRFKDCPRTNAALRRGDTCKPDHLYVTADFADSLERALNDITRAFELQREAIGKACADLEASAAPFDRACVTLRGMAKEPARDGTDYRQLAELKETSADQNRLANNRLHGEVTKLRAQVERLRGALDAFMRDAESQSVLLAPAGMTTAQAHAYKLGLAAMANT